MKSLVLVLGFLLPAVSFAAAKGEVVCTRTAPDGRNLTLNRPDVIEALLKHFCDPKEHYSVAADAGFVMVCCTKG